MISYIFFCLSGLLFVIGFVVALKNMLFFTRAEMAKGEVVDTDNSGSSEESGNFFDGVTIRFKTQKDETVEFKTFELAMFDFDQTNVPVAYDPSNPKRARVKNFIHSYLISLLLVLGSAVAGVGGFVPNLILKLIQR